MPKKHQPPLWLDMDFAEALARFGQTEGAEAKDAEKATATKKRVEPTGPPAEVTISPPIKSGRKRRSS
jgi:hypothetical protein